MEITTRAGAAPTADMSTTAPDAATLELRTIDRQSRRFGGISLATIVVSFVHMAAALALFAGGAWYELGAALAMTALVDVATWAIAEYQHYAKRRRLARSPWVRVTFVVALLISMCLNGAYLYAKRPTDVQLPAWMSIAIAVVFAGFVPLLIGVASLIRGELEDDRLQHEQGTAQAGAAVALLRQDVAHWQAEANRLRHDADQRGAAVEQANRHVEQAKEAVARAEQDAAQWRTVAEQATVQLAQAQAQPPEERIAVAQQAYSLRQLGERLDIPLTTLRRKLAAGGADEK